MHALAPQAFMCWMMWARRSAGVLSMKLTVSRRGEGPQYLPTRMTNRAGVRTSEAAPNGAASGALTGLIFVAVRAALSHRRFGRALMVHPGPESTPLPAGRPSVSDCSAVAGSPTALAAMSAIWVRIARYALSLLSIGRPPRRSGSGSVLDDGWGRFDDLTR